MNLQIKPNLKAKIYKIGDLLVKCENKCSGILKDQINGILPRCLILEMDNRQGPIGCAIVGLNPGHSKNRERNYYVINGQSYDKVVECWNTLFKNVKYYKSLRKIADELGFNGPILWTDLVKCETAPNSASPPLQTFRNCTKTFLQSELNLIDPKWPIIAVGKEAYKALAYLFPNRIIIGVPHPTGSYGHFSRLFGKDLNLREELKIPFDELWNDDIGNVIWLK
jgi:hypothetical protein